MTAWDEFREVLVRLLDERPGVLTGYPNSPRWRTPILPLTVTT